MKDRVLEKSQELTAELAEYYPDLLTKYSIEFYTKNINFHRGEYYRYSFISPRLQKIFTRIEEKYSTHALALYHKLSLSSFMLNSLENFGILNLPQKIETLYNEWFERVNSDFLTKPDSYYNHKGIPFRQDLAVCSGRAIPIGGAWIAEYRRLRKNKYLKKKESPSSNKHKKNTAITDNKKLIKKSIKFFLINIGLFEKAIPILEKLGIYKSYYVIHTVERYLPRFTKEQMDMAYLNIAELLKTHPYICGLFRNSWFLDPNLKNICPAISFLWEVPQKNGAKLFCVGPAEGTLKKNALALSPQRKKLYEEGKYRPMAYNYIWPRQELLRWASEQEENIRVS